MFVIHHIQCVEHVCTHLGIDEEGGREGVREEASTYTGYYYLVEFHLHEFESYM